VFDFGVVPDSILRKEASRAAPLLARGLLDIPFERVLYRYMFIPDAAIVREGGPIPDEMVDSDGKMLPQPYCSLIIRQPHCQWLAFDISAMPDKLKSRLNLPHSFNEWEVTVSGTISAEIDEQGECRWRASKKYYAQVSAVAPEYRQDAADHLLGGLADTIASFSLLLNAKNVPHRIEEPPAKVNAKRERNNKPLLTRVTYIDGARYTTAAYNTSRGNTHASPVPHLRRGHIRHLGERVVWVRDCVVNAYSRDSVDIRNQYNVDTDSLSKGTIET